MSNTEENPFSFSSFGSQSVAAPDVPFPFDDAATAKSTSQRFFSECDNMCDIDFYLTSLTFYFGFLIDNL